jgi:hypothetical protein
MRDIEFYSLLERAVQEGRDWTAENQGCSRAFRLDRLMDEIDAELRQRKSDAWSRYHQRQAAEKRSP